MRTNLVLLCLAVALLVVAFTSADGQLLKRHALSRVRRAPLESRSLVRERMRRSGGWGGGRGGWGGWGNRGWGGNMGGWGGNYGGWGGNYGGWGGNYGGWGWGKK